MTKVGLGKVEAVSQERSEGGEGVHVNDLKPQVHNGKIYDLLGRELKSIPIGRLYIKNGRLYK